MATIYILFNENVNIITPYKNKVKKKIPEIDTLHRYSIDNKWKGEEEEKQNSLYCPPKYERCFDSTAWASLLFSAYIYIFIYTSWILLSLPLLGEIVSFLRLESIEWKECERGAPDCRHKKGGLLDRLSNPSPTEVISKYKIGTGPSFFFFLYLRTKRVRMYT